MSRYDGLDSYVYPDTGVLRNKAGIRDQAGLDAFEADATAVRLLELISNPLQGNFDLAHLCAIHRHLFQDVYEWAGEFQTIDQAAMYDVMIASFNGDEKPLARLLSEITAIVE